MDARKTILRAIRRHEIPEVHAPHLEHAWISYGDSRAQFLAVLESVGGQGHVVDGVAGMIGVLDEIPHFRSAKRVCSLVKQVPSLRVDLQIIQDPHEFKDLDWAIIPGEFAVAENGAIWIINLPSLHRVIPFIAQHLAIVVPAGQIVDNMHQAYDRIHFGKPEFGVFISGPSKTADIEQSLVIGAHGARSLNVFFVD